MNLAEKGFSKILQRHIAVPIEHGSWVFLLSPLVIGFSVAGRLSLAGGLLIAAVLSAFFFRQPLTILVKIFSKRRPRSELQAALFWILIYGLISLLALIWLLILGHHYLLFLAVPALPVLGWHLWLVSRREERRQPVVEIAGSGVLALTAPAAYWVASGSYHSLGWLLWGLCWLQGAASIMYAYMRLEQRIWKEKPDLAGLLKTGRMPLAWTSTNLLLVAALAGFGMVPAWLPLAFGVQLAECLWGIFKPAIKVKPTLIGIRQLLVSTLFTIVFILAYTVFV